MEKLYGLIGFPLGHSFSKKYFTQKFEEAGLTDCSFELFPLHGIEEFSKLVAIQPLLKGLAVTIPYKEKVIPFLNRLHESAESVGAVNCIQFTEGDLIGYNTDALGFEKSFMPLWKPSFGKALVLGTGGASKAVQYILSKNNIQYLLVSRKATGNSIGYEEVANYVGQEYKTIIHCTPVGMLPNEGECPDLPYHLLDENFLVYDLIYKPAETLLLKKAKEQGAVVKNGFEMLLLQAEENWLIWNE